MQIDKPSDLCESGISGDGSLYVRAVHKIAMRVEILCIINTELKLKCVQHPLTLGSHMRKARCMCMHAYICKQMLHAMRAHA